MFLRFKKRNSKKKVVRRAPRQMTMFRKQLIIGIALFLLIGLLVTAIWYGTRLESFQIQKVEAVGGMTISPSDVEDIANDVLDGVYFKLIPKRFAFLYPDDEMVEKIISLDRVKNVYVERLDNHTVAIAFEEYKPYALWCPSFEDTACLFMDVRGFTFAQAPVLTGSAFVRYFGNHDEPTLDTQYFEESFIDETKTFIEMLENELSLYVTHVHKLGDYDIEYFVSGGGTIKISQTLPMGVSFNNLKTILTSEEFSHINPGDFQYIDLRFGDKVFVNEVTEPVATTTATTSTVTQ